MLTADVDQGATMFSAMGPIAKKMTKALKSQGAKYKISEIRVGYRSEFSIHLANYSDELVRAIKDAFQQDPDLARCSVRFRAGLKGIPGAKDLTYRLTRVDSLGAWVEKA
jgi:hypothetical protein